jgi:hypothetical protein
LFDLFGEVRAFLNKLGKSEDISQRFIQLVRYTGGELANGPNNPRV